MKINLPGRQTIPDQIVENRIPYFSALGHSDQAFLSGRIDVSKMETLLESLLAKQLLTIYGNATGKPLADMS